MTHFNYSNHDLYELFKHVHYIYIYMKSIDLARFVCSFSPCTICIEEPIGLCRGIYKKKKESREPQ